MVVNGVKGIGWMKLGMIGKDSFFTLNFRDHFDHFSQTLHIDNRT